jgi:hypothetical protein
MTRSNTVNLYEPQWPADIEPPAPPEPRESNPRLSSPLQQIETIVPAGRMAEYRFLAKGWEPAWREGEHRLAWPPIARSLELRIANPKLAARPIQVWPLDIHVRFRWRFADGKEAVWQRAEPRRQQRMPWPPFAVGIDIEPIE